MAKAKYLAGLPVSAKSLDELANAFKMLSDAGRLHIFLAIARAGEMNVGAICEMTGGTQPAISHHLTLLRLAGLVSYRREGKFNFYSADTERLASVLDGLFAAGGETGRIATHDFTLTFKRAGRK